MFQRITIISLFMFMAFTNAWADVQMGQPDIHVGAIWQYRKIDGFTNETVYKFSQRVVSVNDHEIVIQLKNTIKEGAWLRYFTREWNPVDVGDIKFDPFRPEFKFPMSIGGTWNLNFGLTEHGRSFLSLFKGKIVALEKVTVPAGTFDAYRIENDIETRDTGADANITKGHIITWYSPTAQKYIRRESTTFSGGRVRSNSIDELVEYSLKDNSRTINEDIAGSTTP